MNSSIPEPNPADLARDLVADLALCGLTPAPPWTNQDRPDAGAGRSIDVSGRDLFPIRVSCPVSVTHDGSDRITSGERDAIASFVCAAREGWPAAIRLAFYWKARAELASRRRT